MQLTYPWFLVGLLAVLIPILIHLLQLRRPQRLLFTNTAFIRAVELVTVRQRKFQHLLILLARALAVACLVLVFCQPFIPADQSKGSTVGASVDVWVDNTFSMQVGGTAEGSLLREAISEARNLGGLLPVDGRLRLINTNGALMTPAAFQAGVEELKLSGRASVPAISGRVSERNGSRNPLYLFSDFQKNAFNTGLLDGMGTAREVVLIPLAGKQSGNIYVDSVWLDDAFIRVATNLALRVRLRNGGSAVASDCPVKVLLGSRQVAAFRVTVAPGQAVVSEVQVQLQDNALALGRVVTEDAPVTFDNTYFFTLQPASVIRVLEIGPEPVAQQLYGNEPLFAYSFAKPGSVNYGAMRQANVVLLREARDVDAGLRDALRAVVARGGSVVIVPSALPTSRPAYQQLFRELGVGAAQWEAATATPELREVALPNAQEPFFRDVFGAQQRAVTMPRAAPVLRWSRTGTDVLRFRGGESYLAEFPSGTGKVYVFSAPFSEEYSDFVSHALFVPVLYRMAMLSYRNEQLPAYRMTAGTVTLQLSGSPNGAPNVPASPDEASFRLVKDSLTLIPAQRVVGQEVRLDLPVGMDAPGFYQVQRRGKPVTTLAFNQDKRESELAAYSANELRQLVGNRPNVQVLEAGGNGANLAKFRAAQTGQPLWRYFLAAALACLLTEALLVRFGSQRGAARAPASA